MIQKNLADPSAISAEEEGRIDLEERASADDFILSDMELVINNIPRFELDFILLTIYRSSNDDELLAVHDLKSRLFEAALEIVKRGK